MKKTRSKKSHDTVPLSPYLTVVFVTTRPHSANLDETAFGVPAMEK